MQSRRFPCRMKAQHCKPVDFRFAGRASVGREQGHRCSDRNGDWLSEQRAASGTFAARHARPRPQPIDAVDDATCVGLARLWFGLMLCVVVVATAPPVYSAEPPDAHVAFFEKHVRPLLVKRCYSCHGPREQESGLRLDSRESILRGGDSGPAAVAGRSAESLIVDAIRQTGEFKMPPNKPLAAKDVTAIVRWVDAGLPWPNSKPTEQPHAAAKSHWAFQPVVRPRPPTVESTKWVQSEIDRFVLARLERKGLRPAPIADPVTLIRRATFDFMPSLGRIFRAREPFETA